MADDTLTDLTVLGPEFNRDPYPVYAALRKAGPVHRVRIPGGTEAWLILGHEEGRTALADPRLSKEWSHASDTLGLHSISSGRHMLHSDPPLHTRLRKIVGRAFTPRRMTALAPRVQRLTDTLLDALFARPDDHADLVRDFAFPLPISVICELLGVPVSDSEVIRQWSSRAALQDDATGTATDYIDRLIAQKRRQPENNLLSALIHGTAEDGAPRAGDDGDRLDTEELRGMIWLLLVAGHESTVNLISNGVLALLLHPDQLAELRAHPHLIDQAVEEMLRYEGPVEIPTYRFTTEPYRIGATVIPGGGELVLVALADANRDPARFPEPETFDIHREARGHLAFGHGIHNCLGAPLARIEGRIAINTLLDRCPDLSLDIHPAALVWRGGLLMHGPEHLPVRFR